MVMRTAFTVIVAVLLCIGCTQPPDAAPNPPTGRQPSTSPETTLTDYVAEPKRGLLAGCENASAGGDYDLCVLNAATTLRNMSVCRLADNRSIQIRCRAEASRNKGLCGNVGDGGQRDWCYRSLAFSLNDRSLCEQIDSRQVMEACLVDYVRYKKADPEVCLPLRNITLFDSCVLHHVDVGLMTPPLCVLIIDGDLERQCNQTYLQ